MWRQEIIEWGTLRNGSGHCVSAEGAENQPTFLLARGCVEIASRTGASAPPCAVGGSSGCGLGAGREEVAAEVLRYSGDGDLPAHTVAGVIQRWREGCDGHLTRHNG